MKPSWTLHEAKNKFSQVVNNALMVGPQYVTQRGLEVVVVISVQDYQILTSQKPSFTDFLLQIPKLDGEDPFVRPKEYPRKVEL